MEESSRIVLKLNSQLLQEFKSIGYNAQLVEALYELAEYAGVASSYVDGSEARYSKIQTLGSYVKISDDTSIWSDLSEAFVTHGNRIEYYAIHSNEYGIYSLYSLNADSKRVTAIYDSENMGVEDGLKMLKKWKDGLPKELLSSFPEFGKFSY